MVLSTTGTWMKGRQDKSLQYTPHTASPTHSRSIRILCYDLRVLWTAKSDSKSHVTPMGFRLQTDMNKIFQMRYCMLLWVKRLQSCKLAKFAIKKMLRHFGFEATLFASLCSESLLFGRPGHSELKCQISLGNCSWGYSTLIWHFCILLTFLDAKEPKKIIKGRRRSERPNQRPGTGEFKFWSFFHVIVIIWCWLCTDFFIF